MIEWRGEGTVIGARPHGEGAAIVDVFTAPKGRLSGLVHGGAGRRMAAAVQPGTDLSLRWRARSEAALGTITAEPVRGRAHLLAERVPLLALASACALLAFALPEGEAHPRLHAGTRTLLDALGDRGWELGYLEWEVLLLGETGFALDLSCCAVTGSTEGLAYVSPRTGRAVSEAGAGEWRDRLLPLPPVLLGAEGERPAVAEGLAVTGHFLGRMAEGLGRPLPEARGRLVRALR